MAATWAGAVLLCTIDARSQSLTVRTPVDLVYPEGHDETVDVVVSLLVGVDGRVSEASVVSPPNLPDPFVSAALAAARALVFEPVLVEGTATAVRTELRLHFAPPAVSAAPTARVSSTPPLTGGAETLRIRGQRDAVAVSDLHLHVGALAEVPRRSGSDLLSLAPGLLITNHGGEGHAPNVFLRGFDAGDGQDLELRLDGVPLNEPANAHSHGYADPNVVIPELVDELRVTEGPFDPRQGDFAVAGTADYHLGMHERGLRVTGTLGSWNTGRMLVLWGPQQQELGTFTGVDLRRSDGFGSNRASASANLMTRYESRLGPSTRVSVLGTGYAARFGTAGVIRQEDLLAGRLPCPSDPDSQFFCTYDSSQGGESSRTGLQMRLQHRSGGVTSEHTLHAARRGLRIRDNFTGFGVDRPSDGTSPRGDLSDKRTQTTTVGLRGSLSMRPAWNGRGQQVEVGYALRRDDGDSTALRRRSAGGEPYRTDFDVGFSITNLALYGDAIWHPAQRWTMRGGLRAETFATSLVDRNKPVVDRDGARLPVEWRDAFGLAVLPRLTVGWKPIDTTEWSLSYGEGARSSDPAALSDGEFAPFGRVRALESGVSDTRRLQEGAWSLHTRGAVFATQVDRALLFDEVTARNQLGPPSHRLGAMVLGRTTWSQRLDLQGSVTYAEAYQSPAGTSPWNWESGTRLPYVPRWVSRFDGAWRDDWTVASTTGSWSAAVGASFVAPRPLPLGAESDPIATVDASCSGRWRQAELRVSATNLLDARYRLAEYNYASSFNGPDAPASLRASRHVVAGAPRQVLVSLTLFWDTVRPEVDPDHDVHDDEPRSSDEVP